MFELILLLALQCDGDACVMVPDPAPPVPHVAVPTEGPQRSILVRRSRLVMFPVIREVQPARKLARGTVKVAQVLLPPYPRVRDAIAEGRVWYPGKNVVRVVRRARCK